MIFLQQVGQLFATCWVRYFCKWESHRFGVCHYKMNIDFWVCHYKMNTDFWVCHYKMNSTSGSNRPFSKYVHQKMKMANFGLRQFFQTIDNITLYSTISLEHKSLLQPQPPVSVAIWSKCYFTQMCNQTSANRDIVPSWADLHLLDQKFACQKKERKKSC